MVRRMALRAGKDAVAVEVVVEVAVEVVVTVVVVMVMTSESVWVPSLCDTDACEEGEWGEWGEAERLGRGGGEGDERLEVASARSASGSEEVALELWRVSKQSTSVGQGRRTWQP